MGHQGSASRRGPTRQIILTADFSPDPGSYANVQINPNAPWRILIRNLYQADGVTKTVGRAPGQLVAVIEEAKNVGASMVYNSPGEIHFTLLKDDEQIDVIEPKQTHYAVEFYSGDGWQEKYAGVVWEMDATETDVVFKGIDYLALYDTIIDERYDPLKPNKSYKSNGSFYENVVDPHHRHGPAQLGEEADRLVGGLHFNWAGGYHEREGSVYSTCSQPCRSSPGCSTATGRARASGPGCNVVKLTTGATSFRIDDDPGVIRNDLAMYYGELVQGYRVIVFGDGWANVEHVVGRNRDGAKVTYKTIKGSRSSPRPPLRSHRHRRRHGRRAGPARPEPARPSGGDPVGEAGQEHCNWYPHRVPSGRFRATTSATSSQWSFRTAPSTRRRFGSGFWCAWPVAWEATDIGEQSLIITFMPREDATSPDPNLIPSTAGQHAARVAARAGPRRTRIKASSKYWLDQTRARCTPATTRLVHSTPSDGHPMSTINRVAHGLVAGQRVVFSSVVPLGTGIDTDTVYFVVSAGLTANAFQISETDGARR
jgi:hypothetical protein